MSVGNGTGIAGARPADFDKDGTHDAKPMLRKPNTRKNKSSKSDPAIKASSTSAFKAEIHTPLTKPTIGKNPRALPLMRTGKCTAQA